MKINVAGYTVVILAAAFLLVSCSPRTGLITRGAREADVEGTYRVIYYGCNFLSDFETAAFLDLEGDGYTFEPFAPDFNYRVSGGLTAKEALATAEKFLRCNTAFSQAQLRSIPSPSGRTIGYEVQPIYQPFVYGGGEALRIDYRLQDGRVLIYIQPAAWVERMLSGGRGRDHD